MKEDRDLGPVHSDQVVAGLYQAFGAIIALLVSHGEPEVDILKNLPETIQRLRSMINNGHLPDLTQRESSRSRIPAPGGASTPTHEE